MNNLLTVPKLGFLAIGFVLQNLPQCLYRALPVMLASGMLSLFGDFTNGSFGAVGGFIEVLLYSIFAVSWHRYSLIPAEREKKGFPLQLGGRELKFALFAIFSSIVLAIAVFALAAVLPGEVAAFVVIILLLLPACILAFFYPAIALDQPLQFQLFVTKGIEFSFSIVLTAFLGSVIAGILIALSLLISLFIGGVFSEVAGTFIAVLFLSATFSVILAVSVSTASFLYYNAIGLREFQQTA